MSGTMDFTKRFTRERGGSVAITTALTITTLFVAAGGAVDYTNAVRKNQQAQQVLDATALRLAVSDLDGAALQAEGERVFRSMIAQRGLAYEVSDVRFEKLSPGVAASADLGSRTAFLGLVGIDTVGSAVSAQAMPPERKPIEIALVLDVSGSMSEDLNGGPRIDRLKLAVGDMLDTLDAQLPDGTDWSVGVVPYSTSVNLGNLPGVLEGASVNGLPAPTAGADVWAAERVVAENGGTFTVDDAPGSSVAVPFVTAAEMPVTEPEARIMPLTDQPKEVRKFVGTLEPSGWTAGHLGMMWGVHVLSDRWGGIWPSAPKAEGEGEKIVVMMTDGKFNTTHGIGARSTNDGDTSYAYFDAACGVAEAKGMRIFIVALNLDEATVDRLAPCATVDGAVYTPDTAAGLREAFRDIAIRLGRTRLTG